MSPPFSPRSVSHRSHPISYNSDSPLSASLYAHKVAPSPPSHDTCVFSTLAWSLSPRAPDRAVQMLSLPECPGSSHRIAYISLRQTRCSRSCLNQRSSPKTHLKLSSPQPLEKYPTIPSMRSTKRTPLKSCLLENVVAINGLLANHKHNLDTQVVELEAEIVKLASKRGSGVWRRMLCFQ